METQQRGGPAPKERLQKRKRRTGDVIAIIPIWLFQTISLTSEGCLLTITWKLLAKEPVEQQDVYRPPTEWTWETVRPVGLQEGAGSDSRRAAFKDQIDVTLQLLSPRGT